VHATTALHAASVVSTLKDLSRAPALRPIDVMRSERARQSRRVFMAGG